MFIICKLKEHLFKIKLLGAVFILAVLLFYVLPYLLGELLLVPKQNEMYDKSYREPLRVELSFKREVN